MRFFHGGARGYNVGDEILSPETLDAAEAVRLSGVVGGHNENAARILNERVGRISVTTDKRIARMFAMLLPNGGALYQIETQDSLEPDERAQSVSFRVYSATVVAVYDAMVPFNGGALKKLARYVAEHEKENPVSPTASEIYETLPSLGFIEQDAWFVVTDETEGGNPAPYYSINADITSAQSSLADAKLRFPNANARIVQQKVKVAMYGENSSEVNAIYFFGLNLTAPTASVPA